MNFGKEIKNLRKALNLSQAQLAKETGMSQQAISFWEQDKRTPNVDDCIALADYFGITLDELVGREFNNKKTTITYNNSTHNGNNNF